MGMNEGCPFTGNRRCPECMDMVKLEEKGKTVMICLKQERDSEIYETVRKIWRNEFDDRNQ